MPSKNRTKQLKDRKRKAAERHMETTQSTETSQSLETSQISQSLETSQSIERATACEEQASPQQHLVHQYLFHDFEPKTVLQGEILIAALDLFSDLTGLIPPTLLYGAVARGESLRHLEVKPTDTAVQLHYIHGHYLVSTQHRGVVTVYDSLPSQTRVSDLLPQLQALYQILQGLENPSASVQYVVPQFQGATADCGAFAMANAYHLLNGEDPLAIHLNQRQLRHHLYNCLLSKSVTPFPCDIHPQPEISSQLGKYFTASMQQSKMKANQPRSEKTVHSKQHLDRKAKDRERKQQKRMDKNFRLAELEKKKKDSVKLHECEHKQQKRKSEAVRLHELEHKQQKRKSEAFKTDELLRKKKDSVRLHEREHKQQKRKSEAVRLHELEHKQQKRKSEAFKTGELLRKKKDSVRLHEREHKQQKRKSEAVRLHELEHKQQKRKSEAFKTDELLRKKKDSVRLHEREHKQQKRKSEAVRLHEREHKQQKRKSEAVRLHEREHKQQKRKSEAVRSHEREHKQQKRKSKAFKTGELLRKRRHSVRLSARKLMRQKRKSRLHVKAINERRVQQKAFLTMDLRRVIQQFHTACSEIPVHVCCVCFKILFRKQVISFKVQKYPDTDFVKSLITSHFHIPTCPTPCQKCASWICHTCDSNILRTKLPNQALENGLYLEKLPEVLHSLNQLEKHLVSPILPFVKIVTLPKGLQKGIHGPVVCVPSDIPLATNTLPRPLHDDTLVKVKLKRKMEYAGHYLYQQVSVNKIFDAVTFLKDVNPHFKDIQLDTTSLTNTDQMDPDTAAIIEDNGEVIVESEISQTSTEILENGHNVNEPVIGKQNDINTDNKLEHAPASEIHDTSCPMVSCLQPTDLEQYAADHLGNQIFSVAPGEGHKPCSPMDIETQVFPYYFPDGKNGLKETRQNKLGINRYANVRLFSADSRFASDPHYIFYLQYVSELSQIISSASIAMRKGAPVTSAGQKITGKMLKDARQRKHLLSTDQGYRFLKTIRGTPAYWEKTLRDLFAMVRQLGTPTWFCSFSAADRRWPEICAAICKQQGRDVPQQMDWVTHCQIINSNPVTACRMFENRVTHFIQNVILSPAAPIGKVSDYFIRTEFQSRGWPHIHCLFWCEDAPKFSTNTDNQDFLDYVDKYVSCAIPAESPDLFEIVSQVQMHSKSHTPSCRKGSNANSCRFHFPRPPSVRTFIAEPPKKNTTVPSQESRPQDSTSPPGEQSGPQPMDTQAARDLLKVVWDIVSKADDSMTAADVLNKIGLTQATYQEVHSLLSKRNTVIFKRDCHECWVNPYNPHLLSAWNGNMDIQPVLDAYSCIMYIVSYISKAEREMGDLLKRAHTEAKDGNLDALQQLRQLGNVYLHHREVSIMEAIYRVTSMKLKQASRQTIFVPTDPESIRISKPLKMIKEDDDDEDVWMTSLHDRYLARPHTSQFEEMSFAHFASNFQILPSQTKQSDTRHAFHLSHGLGKIAQRKTPAVVRYPKFSCDKDPERYYANKITMYYPHRAKNVKPPQFETFQAMFEEYTETILQNMTTYEKLSSELEEAWEHLQAHGIQEDAWAELIPNQEQQRAEEQTELAEMTSQRNDFVEIDPNDIPDLNTDTTSTRPIPSRPGTGLPSVTSLGKTNFTEALRGLNSKQCELFYFIKDWALKKAINRSTKPFHIFLTGGAGTGKSHLVKCIYNEVAKILPHHSGDVDSMTQLLLAPTGTAAYNIGGQTIHSALKVNRATSKTLSEDQANALRSSLQDLELIIIDEVSMVTPWLLETVHARLQQIKQPFNPRNVFFGNVSILAVGDFHQVPPVKGKLLCLHTLDLIDLWCIFHIWELTEVVRQKGDHEFIDMLNRLRTKSREDPLLPQDRSLLQCRLISNQSSYPEEALHIFPTNAQLNRHNDKMLETLKKNTETIIIKAADICTSQATNKSYQKNTPLQTKEAVLPAEITLCQGARVMLCVNVDVSDGLSNGVLGTVTKIISGTSHLGLPNAVCVHFDDSKIGATSRQVSPPLQTFTHQLS